MAYRKEIKLKCWWPGCTATARWEVFGSAGENYGNYCLRHAKMKEVEVAQLETDAVSGARWLEQFGEPE